MITAEEFFRNKIKEQKPNREVITLSQELITAEQGMRWAHEFKQLHLHDVVGQSELLLDFAKYMNKFTPSPNLEESEINDYLKQKSNNHG